MFTYGAAFPLPLEVPAPWNDKYPMGIPIESKYSFSCNNTFEQFFCGQKQYIAPLSVWYPIFSKVTSLILLLSFSSSSCDDSENLEVEVDVETEGNDDVEVFCIMLPHSFNVPVIPYWLPSYSKIDWENPAGIVLIRPLIPGENAEYLPVQSLLFPAVKVLQWFLVLLLVFLLIAFSVLLCCRILIDEWWGLLVVLERKNWLTKTTFFKDGSDAL